MEKSRMDNPETLASNTLKIPKGGNQNPISKKNRQHNGQKKKYKKTNNGLQNTTYKTKNRVTRTLLKTGGELVCSGRVGSFASLATLGTNHRTKTKNI